MSGLQESTITMGFVVRHRGIEVCCVDLDVALTALQKALDDCGGNREAARRLLIKEFDDLRMRA